MISYVKINNTNFIDSSPDSHLDIYMQYWYAGYSVHAIHSSLTGNYKYEI